MSDQIMADGNELPEDNATEQPVKTYTQEEVDRFVTERLARERRANEKKYGSIDVDEYTRLKEMAEAAELERTKKEGDFDKAMKQMAEKKDAQISAKDQMIQNLTSKLNEIQVDGSLLNAASTNNAVNPAQVVQLLKSQTRLNDDGDVEVLDSDGSVRYNDSGSPLSVNELVSDFLTANPHFVRASSGGAGSKGAAGGSTPKPQSVADMLANWETGGKEAFAALKGKR